MSDLALGLLRDLLRDRLGARPQNPVVTDLAPRLRALAAGADPVEVVRGLRDDPAALAAAAGDLTIGETWLFRDAPLFRFVEEQALPAARARAGVARLWSAGCATGEEAHTLAFVARRALGGRPVEVLGTDLDPARLERARAGRYPRRAARGHALPAFFAEERGDELVVRPQPGVALRFEAHNLAQDPPPAPGGFELIMCRNVLLYLHDAAVRRALEAFVAALLPGGFLILGPSDVIERSRIVPFDLSPVEGRPTVWRKEPRPAPAAPPAPRPQTTRVLFPLAVTAPRTEPAPPTPGERARRLVLLAEARLATGDELGAEAACLEALDQAGDEVEAVLVLARMAQLRGDAGLASRLLAPFQRDGDPRVARAAAALGAEALARTLEAREETR